ncbi:MAG: hypothetical protein KAS60_06750 [Thermoplasmata archaeon]|nr:hypothetical protein [Candidatus Thermoplasmatota archaeon]MCK4949766.1 hypothetical protein [Thermoplasmata archaeon]
MAKITEEEFMERARVDRVTFYKHKEGGKVDDLDFITHENVYLFSSHETMAVFEDDKVTVYPSARLYEYVISGPTTSFVKDRYLLSAAVEEKQVTDSKTMLKDMF